MDELLSMIFILRFLKIKCDIDLLVLYFNLMFHFSLSIVLITFCTCWIFPPETCLNKANCNTFCYIYFDYDLLFDGLVMA